MRWFSVERGVHQGAPLSIPLYQIFINDLVITLKTNEYGIMIGKTNVTCPAYTDDLAMMALYKPGWNELLQIAYDHSVKWNYTFSIKKNVVIFFG